jgi:hypothetical protein
LKINLWELPAKRRSLRTVTDYPQRNSSLPTGSSSIPHALLGFDTPDEIEQRIPLSLHSFAAETLDGISKDTQARSVNT